MPRGKPSPKLAITVDAEVHQKVVEAAAAAGVSVSAWMTSAARQALLVRDGLAAVVEWEREHGALTEDELAEARERVASQVASETPKRSRRPA
jgi:DNA-binding IclR family transcriptional regulator